MSVAAVAEVPPSTIFLTVRPANGLEGSFDFTSAPTWAMISLICALPDLKAFVAFRIGIDHLLQTSRGNIHGRVPEVIV